MPVSEFCEHYLGLSYSQARSDLDHWIPVAAADALATITGLDPQSIVDLEIPPELKRRSFDSSSRTFCQPVAYCPLCLEEEPYARRSWRSRLAVVCARHGTELSVTCNACGSAIPYSGSWLGFAAHYWLELGPICPACAAPLGHNHTTPAPPRLLQASRIWSEVLRPGIALNAEASIARLTVRLVEIARARKEILAAVRASGYVGSWPAHAATAALFDKTCRTTTILRLHYAAMRPSFFAACVANFHDD